MRDLIDRSDPLWYKDAIIYQTHIKAFFDANNDGVGDFQGLIQKLDYIQELGVTAIWLLPFYPSPLRDDGYDIRDYRAINPAYGTMRDVRRLIREAHRRGIRVITELVINHTSDQHEWFQRARRAKPGTRQRDYYVWSDTDQKYTDTRIIFLDTEGSNWTWDPVAKAYFWHRFYSHQPDLNFDNPAVVREVINLFHYWLRMGIDGIRLDAIPYLVEREGTNCENLPETHDLIKRFRRELDEHFPDRMLLAEANQWPEDTRPYFGEGDECHMAFHFPLMPRMYMALAQEDRHPITDIMRQTPDIPDICQWAIFLRNHDELTLEMVTANEREYLWNFYANDRRMRINLGIRRRLAPLLDNDRRKIELMNSMLFSMPGTPVVYYGDEIGMGDNIYLGDRDGVRTPMQWSPDRNGGFSRANPQQLYLPAVMDPVYGFDAVNVEAQTRNPSSLLNWMRRIIAVRRNHKAFSRGSLSFLYPGNRKVLAYLRAYGGETVLCVVNLSRNAQPVELELAAYRGRVPVELIGRSPFPPIGDLPYLLTLPGYGFYWFMLTEEAELPRWHETIPEPLPEFVTIVVTQDWQSVIDGKGLKDLETSVLPNFARNQRWFAAKDARINAARLARHAVLPGRSESFLLAEFEVELGGRDVQRYLLPLAIAWGEEHVGSASPLLPFMLAKVRRGPRLGALYDATAGTGIAWALLDGMRGARRIEGSSGTLVFAKGAHLDEVQPEAGAEVRRMGVEQSNSSLMIGREVIIKLYRRLQPGIHPEVEIGRFLTDIAGFANTPPLLGTLEFDGRTGETTALAAAFGFVLNQGDGWSFTLEYLGRELDALTLTMPADLEDQPADPEEVDFSVYRHYARILGQRTGELHRAFAIDTDDPAFAREPITGDDLETWRRSVAAQAKAGLASVERAMPRLDDSHKALAEELMAAAGVLEERLAVLTGSPVEAAKTRLHGDYHLGQVVVARDDFYLLDFEGEPARSLEERRAKLSPLKDVAGMLRSFDYASWTAAETLKHEHAGRTARLESLARGWRSAAMRAFLDAYLEATRDSAVRPASIEDANRLLELHLLEKAFYELAYEAANRPAWLWIPLAGLVEILRGTTQDYRFRHADDQDH